MLKTTDRYELFWRFVAERQSIFCKKLNNEEEPWTNDLILQKNNFTNVYRVLDRHSQYLIKSVIEKGSQDSKELFFRIMLFRIFSKIQTWEYLEKNLREISFSNFSFHRYDILLLNLLKSDIDPFTSAYMTPDVKSFGYVHKHRNFLILLENMMKDRVYERICECKLLRCVFNILKSFPMIGEFFANQMMIDLNYSDMLQFSENDFISLAKGSRTGLKMCIHYSEVFPQSEILYYMVEHQEEEFAKFGIEFQKLRGRNLTLVDIEHSLCEFYKYEIAKRSVIQHEKYAYKRNLEPISFVFPRKWDI